MTATPAKSGNPPKIIVFSSEKGGVGKTTTTVNMGALLASYGCRVLIIDFDPQVSTCECFALGAIAKPRTICALMHVASNGGIPDVAAAIIDMSHELPEEPGGGALHIIGTSTATMTEYTDYVTNAAKQPESRKEATLSLRRFLLQYAHGYDYILIDNPPTTNALNVVPLAAADYVCGVSEPEFLSVKGIITLYKEVQRVPEITGGEARPVYLGTLLNGTDLRETAQARKVRADYEAGFPDPTNGGRTSLRPFEKSIRDFEDYSKAVASGLPAVLLYPDQPCADQYQDFAEELASVIGAYEAGSVLA